jgi:hypothetical protein
MPPAKKTTNAAAQPSAAPQAVESQPASTSSSRKAWVPKSPVEVVLDQIKRQEDRVSRLQAEVDAETVTLNKLRKAKAVLEAAS